MSNGVGDEQIASTPQDEQSLLADDHRMQLPKMKPVCVKREGETRVSGAAARPTSEEWSFFENSSSYKRSFRTSHSIPRYFSALELSMRSDGRVAVRSGAVSRTTVDDSASGRPATTTSVVCRWWVPPKELTIDTAIMPRAEDTRELDRISEALPREIRAVFCALGKEGYKAFVRSFYD